MTVLFFGQLAEMAGLRELTLEAAENTAVLRNILNTRFPVLKEAVYKIAVNSVISEKDMALDADSTIALLPPFSGG